MYSWLIRGKFYGSKSFSDKIWDVRIATKGEEGWDSCSDSGHVKLIAETFVNVPKPHHTLTHSHTNK